VIKLARRSKYDPDITPEIAEQYARDGLINEEIASKLGISTTTFYNWQKKYVEFSEALKKGKQVVDAKVEKALLKRALGYDYDEIKVTVNESGQKKVEKTKKQVKPDTTAQIFWLKNRLPDKWRDKHEIDQNINNITGVEIEFIEDD
jgi:transposase-like protein